MYSNNRISKLLLVTLSLSICISVIWSGANVLSATPTAPTGLLTNGVDNPKAIDNGNPLFTWIMNDADRGETQTSYQILVASSQANIDGNVGDLWDSGRVYSSKSAAVKYSGNALTAAARYWWKVRTWDKDANLSPYSAAATFDIGLAKTDWTANYIWDGTNNQNNFAYFRKSFSISKTIKLAKVFVSAHNDYLLFLNGTQLGFGPARSDPYNYGQYDGYDITAQLVSGSNAFAAMAHWHGAWGDSGVNGSPAFILEARIQFTDGTSLTVKTDNTWKMLAATPFSEASPVYFGGAGGANNRAALKFDARNEPAGWTGAGFNDGAWANAVVVDRSSYNLYAQLMSREGEQAELAPVSVTPSGSDWLVDFGKCINGWPKLTMRSNTAGSAVTVEYYQLSGTGGDAGWDQYTCKGGTETWKPNFGRHTSFRTLKVRGYAGTLSASDIRGVWAYSGANKTGNFTCSSTLLNDIYEMCERSGRQNVQQGIISVDANREQSPWTADSWNVGNGLLYNHKNTMIFDKIIKDYAAEQLASGNFPSCAPNGQFDIPEWSMYWPMLLWQQYLFSGDEELLNSKYTNLQRFLTWLNGYNQASNLINPPGWRISEYAGGSLESGGENIATNCQYYENLWIASQIATILGRTADAGTYSSRADVVKTAINNNLFTGQSYYSKVGSAQQHPLGSAWALRFDLVPPANKANVIQWIMSQANPSLGGYGGDAYYNGTFSAGGMGGFLGNDLNRYSTMHNSNDTNWETWDAGEYNHAWTSYCSYIFQRYISGIQPTGGAFANFNIKPEIGGLTYADSTVPTVKGDIATRWEKVAGDKLTLTCTVPANTTARVYLPKYNLANIQIKEGTTVIWNNGTYIGGVAGIGYDGEESLYVRFNAGSGSYSFEITGTVCTSTPTPTPSPTPSPRPTYTPGPPPSGTNLALNKTVTDSSTVGIAAWDAAKAVDGVINSGGTSYGWSSNDGVQNRTEWIKIDLVTAGNINKVYLYPRNDSGKVGEGFPLDFSIKLSTDNTNWTTVATEIGYPKPGNGYQYFGFTSTSARYVMVETTKVRYNVGENTYYVQLAEIEVYNGGGATATPTPTSTSTPTPTSAVTPTATPGGVSVIIDNDDSACAFTGTWVRNTINEVDQRYGASFHYAAAGDGSIFAKFTPNLSTAGSYNVYAWWTTHTNRATNAPYTIYYNGGNQTVTVNQELNGGQWNLLGTYNFAAGTAGYVKLANNANEYVVADAVKFELISSATATPAPTATATPTPTLTSTPLPVNLALNKTVTSSSSHENDGWGMSKAVDGQRSAVAGAYGWSSENSLTVNHTEWVTVDLGVSNNISKADLYPRNDGSNTGYGFPIDFTIKVSTDNTNWTTVVTRTGYALPGGTVQSFTFTSQSARYVKIEGTSLRQNPSENNWYRMQLAEMEVYN
jgi:alpha-L-rhamnosidase